MKLFTKYNRINLISTVIIFLLGSFAFSVLLRYVIINQVDEDLKIEKNEVITYANRFNHLPDVIEVRDQYTVYKSISKPGRTINKIFTHESYDAAEQEKELQRTIEFDINANNFWYQVSVSKSLEGTDVLIKNIIIITLSVILLILAVTFFINRIVLKKLWKPFYSTLQTMQQFTLSNAQTLNFSESNIDEFNYLNTVLTGALTKAQHDYKILKEFTENASHELQTPLAVIQSKLDLLIQNEKFTEAESNAIQSAYDALHSLRKLNQSLLLLAKIENNQFSEQTNLDVKELLQNKINQFAELWKNKNIRIDEILSAKTISGNIYLIEILLSNLLSNATKHNTSGGSIKILLQRNVEITNTGIAQPLDEALLFKRFSKQNNASINHGLGLSIIHQICIASGYACTYNFSSPNLHTFKINW